MSENDCEAWEYCPSIGTPRCNQCPGAKLERNVYKTYEQKHVDNVVGDAVSVVEEALTANAEGLPFDPNFGMTKEYVDSLYCNKVNVMDETNIKIEVK